MIPFGEYLPDLPVYNNPGATEAKNVLPSGDSYKPFPSLSIYSNALAARCQGAIYGRDDAGNVYNFAGDASKLYKMASATWSDVSVTGGYTVSNTEFWEFTQFGQKIIATTFGNPIQVFTQGTSTNFANLSASAPQARHIAVIRDFVVAGNTYDTTDGNKPSRVQWSGIGDPTSWTVSPVTQSDYQNLDGPGGWVQRIIGGEYGVIFQERAIWRMTYVGSPIIFQFDEVETNRGTPAPQSVIKVGNWIAYLGVDGFYIFDGNTSMPIGVNKVDKTFYNDLDQSNTYRVVGAVDPINQILFWAYPGAGNVGGNPNKIIAYNYSPNATKRWSYGVLNTEYIYRSAGEGYTLDGLDTVSTSLDALAFSLDSRVWTGNTVLLSAFDANHKMANLSGAALDAVLETQEVELLPGRRSRVSKLRPLVDGTSSSITVQVGSRNTLNEAVTWDPTAAPATSGNVSVRNNARYHRARVNVSGGFTHAQGIDVIEAFPGGKR